VPIRTPQNPFVRSGIRLAVGILVVDLICLYFFDDNAASLFASFACLILLYFLDFEGGARQRLVAYSAALLVGLFGLVIGTYAAPITWLAVVLTIPVAFAFAYARVLKGFVARCAVGLQLSFILPVMLPATPSRIGYYVGGWLIGGTVAIIAALTVLPRQRLTLTRGALAAWCSAAAHLTRLYAEGVRTGEGRNGLKSAFDDLQRMTVGSALRPGSLTHRLRALLQMVQYANASTNLALSIQELAPDGHVDLLANASAETFDASAKILIDDGQLPMHVDMDVLRHQDLLDVQEWCAQGLSIDPARTFDDLRDHYPIRLIAILASVMQWLALRSSGAPSSMPELGAFESSSPGELLRGNFRMSSPWFRNAVRTGIAAAAAVGLAQAMGLKHGFWVVLATISILQLSFTSPQTGRLAVKTVGGTVAGILVGAAVVVIIPSQPVFLILLVASAFLAKISQSKSITIAQFAFTPFAIINVSLLTWPPSTDTVISRLLDVLVGLLVAIVLTMVIFPRGISRLIQVTGFGATRRMQAYVDAVLDVITGRRPTDDLDEKRSEALRDLQNFSDTLDAAFMTARTITPQIVHLEARQAWLQDALLAGDVLRKLTSQSDQLVKVPELIAALDLPSGNRIEHMREIVVKDHERLALHPHAFVSAVWSGWWLDFLDSTRPAAERPND
jgi:uncharacterized membrane protein YccC